MNIEQTIIDLSAKGLSNADITSELQRLYPHDCGNRKWTHKLVKQTLNVDSWVDGN